ncbi:MAG: RsmE family RNA methyltransferase [Elusimicrobiota bacterium]
MPQFLLSKEDIQDKKFVLRGPEAFHVARVLRSKPGDPIELFDGHGGRYKGVVRLVRPDGSVEGDIVEKLHVSAKSTPARLRLYLSLLKPSHWDWALEKGTEIGVSTFVPVVTPRTVVQLRTLSGTKDARWKKVVTAAAKQCRRADIPEVTAPMHFRDAIRESCKGGLTLVAWEKHSGNSTYAGLREVLRTARQGNENLLVNIFVGPEGGFSEDEIELAECEGAALFSLGPNTLRAETAALVACAIVFYELGDL